MKATLSNLVDQRPENKTIDQIIFKNFRNTQDKFPVARNLRFLSLFTRLNLHLLNAVLAVFSGVRHEMARRFAEY